MYNLYSARCDTEQNKLYEMIQSMLLNHPSCYRRGIYKLIHTILYLLSPVTTNTINTDKADTIGPLINAIMPQVVGTIDQVFNNLRQRIIVCNKYIFDLFVHLLINQLTYCLLIETTSVTTDCSYYF